MNTLKILEDYGLKERHAQIYLACLELGSASIQKISVKSGYARATCEAVLESLQSKGWVSSFHKKRTKHYSAEDPHKVLHSAKEKVALLERTLPDLMDLYGTSKASPMVRFYPGKKGMKRVLEEILSEARSQVTELLSFSSVDDMFDLLGPDFYEFVKRRVAKKVRSRVILRDSPKARERLRLAGEELRSIKLIPPSYEHHGLLFIWGRKIAMLSMQKEFNMLVIESEELSQMMRVMFEAFWSSLPTPKP